MRIGNHALEELARKVRRQGVSIEITGAGHLRWMLPDGSSFVTANSTKSARVAIKARLRQPPRRHRIVTLSRRRID